MKVNIGPYTQDLIPVNKMYYMYEHWRAGPKLYLDDSDWTWYDQIVFDVLDSLDDLFRPINRWARNRPRKIEVHIDDYDVWGADHTLAIVIHPVLVKLKEKKQGSAIIDNKDIPKNLGLKEHEDRWDYVLDEMIWAFEQHKHDDRNEDQFNHNKDQLDMTFEKIEGSTHKQLKTTHQKDPTKPAYYVDEEGKKAHVERVANGRRLFAKYFDALWD